MGGRSGVGGSDPACRRLTPPRLVPAALAVALGVVAVALVPPAATALPPPSYVALGDSYTAGPLIPNQEGPPGCFRSSTNYPHYLAGAFGLPAFRDVSCSGARTRDMTAPQVDGSGRPVNPPQLEALDENTRIVTVTIGGNDIGFAEIGTSCLSLTPLGSPCQDRYVVDGVDTLEARIRSAAPDVAAVLGEIRARSPLARVLVLTYPAILPEDAGATCWPQLPLARADIAYVRNLQKKLNAMVAAQAEAAGATVVDVYAASIGRDSCQLPLHRWVEPLVPASPAFPIHPNVLGMQGMAAAVLQRMQAP
ncbi:MAG TPA: SGNH/GDSL hydrolase family protein [Acidimicrobiales bacterium]|nr:SGNH/GDSL hydrolase family protein [Acidimicrobiales bacterium]